MRTLGIGIVNNVLQFLRFRILNKSTRYEFSTATSSCVLQIRLSELVYRIFFFKIFQVTLDIDNYETGWLIASFSHSNYSRRKTVQITSIHSIFIKMTTTLSTSIDAVRKARIRNR